MTADDTSRPNGASRPVPHDTGVYGIGANRGVGAADAPRVEPAVMPPEAEARIEAVKRRYPDEKSAVMEALYLVQEHLGSVTPEGIAWAAARVGLAPVHVAEVATFYTMYYKKPVGRYHFQVCRTLSCAVRGAGTLTKALAEKFGTAPNEVTPDGKWSYEEVECLGSCGTAPMCELNDVYFENLTPESLLALVERADKESPDLRLSPTKDSLGTGLPDMPRSRVYDRA